MKKSISDFEARCYQALRKIPKGKVTTYKILAEHLGSRGYRAVGNAMRKNPDAPEVPCHRVICSDGSLGGYAFGLDEKIRLLEEEKVTVESGKIDLLRFAYKFED